MRLTAALPLAALLLAATPVWAVPSYTYEIDGTANGQVGGTFFQGAYVGASPLNNTPFSLIALGDAGAVTPTGGGFTLVLDSVSIDFAGIGTATLQIPFELVVTHGAASLFLDSLNGNNDAIGFRSVIPQAGPPALASYNGQSPLSGVGLINEALQIGQYGIDSSLGKVDLTSLSAETLTAAPVPEPASAPLLAICAATAALLTHRPKRR